MSQTAEAPICVQQTCDCPSCGGWSDFAGRVQQWIDERDVIQQGLIYEGWRLVDRLADRHGIRGLSRKSGLSATYLSQVRNQRAIVSPHAFVRLSEIERTTEA